MEFLSPEFFSALFAIIIIDLVLAGDNAIVIALAARNLPPRLRTKAVAWGTIGAIAVRTAMTLVVVWLLKVPGLLLIGGALLVWIAYKLLVDDSGDSHEVAAAQSFAGAMKTIVVADALMGLDNVLAVAGAAQGSFLLVVLGLLISIPIVIWGSQLILKFVERFPIIVYIGSGVLAWTAVKMMTSEPLVRDFVAAHPVVNVLGYIVVVGGVLGCGFFKQHASVRARVAACVASQPEVASASPDGLSKILVAVDGSPNSVRAVRHVLRRYLTEGGLEVHLLHVHPNWAQRLLRGAVDRSLAEVRAALDDARVPYVLHQEQGDFAHAVERVAQRVQVHSIAIGTAPSRSLTRIFQDAVMHRLLKATTFPVEIIPGTAVSPFERLGVAFGAGALALTLAIAMVD